MRLTMMSAVAIGAVFLSACSVTTQNTSGRDYLSRYSTAQSQVFQSGQAGRVGLVWPGSTMVGSPLSRAMKR